MYIIIAQIIRIIASIFGLISDRATEPKKIYFYNSLYNIFCSVQYFLLNAIAGAITSILALFRNLLLYRYGKKLPIIILIIYLLLTAILDLTVYDGIISIIPIIGGLLYFLVLLLGLGIVGNMILETKK